VSYFFPLPSVVYANAGAPADIAMPLPTVRDLIKFLLFIRMVFLSCSFSIALIPHI